MKISLIVSALLVVPATAALAQQPAVYPLRSQSAAAQGVDSAYCYWQAKQQTGVNMTRLSQRPQRTKPIPFAADAGKGASEPPLPGARGTPSGGSRTSMGAMTASGAGSMPAVSGVPAQGAQPARPGGPNAASATGDTAQTPAPASSASGSAASSASTNLPPLPPPPPPMTTYWQAYGDCMQARGYGVH